MNDCPKIVFQDAEQITLEFTKTLSQPFDINKYNQAQIRLILRSAVNVIVVDTNPTQLNRSVEVTLFADSQIVYDHDQDYSVQESQHLNFNFILQENSTLQFFLANTNAFNTIYDLHISLKGVRSTAYVRGLYALTHNQKISFNTDQTHHAPHTLSSLQIYGALAQAAQSDYKGNIYVGQCAKQTNALQENKNILLHGQARAHSVPSLEVLTNDVQCKHGTATGFLNDEHILYLQSRGISPENAQHILIKSFFAQMMATLNETVVSDINKRIERQIS